MKKKLNRKQMIPVRLEHEQVKAIDKLCIDENCYRSEIIRRAIDMYLKQQKQLNYVSKL